MMVVKQGVLWTSWLACIELMGTELVAFDYEESREYMSPACP